jgi:lipopolysaccharide biosynthesis glycosyltransferase
MIPIFIGYDVQEPISFQVAAHSLLSRSSEPIAIHPLALSQLGSIFNRPREAKQATDFSFSRFLVPYLCQFQGWAIFMDCDVLCLDDIAKLWSLRDERYAVMVVKHDHVPKETTKFLGHAQTSYPMKNWSSVMLINNARCQMLTPDYVNTASGLELHRFRWLDGEQWIGELPARWNHLVDYDSELPPDELSLLHYTSGGPWFTDYSNCGYADLWRADLANMNLPFSKTFP